MKMDSIRWTGWAISTFEILGSPRASGRGVESRVLEAVSRGASIPHPRSSLSYRSSLPDARILLLCKSSSWIARVAERVVCAVWGGGRGRTVLICTRALLLPGAWTVMATSTEPRPWTNHIQPLKGTLKVTHVLARSISLADGAYSRRKHLNELGYYLQRVV